MAENIDKKILDKAKTILKKAQQEDVDLGILQAAQQLRTYIVRNKLSGQVLKRQSGDLAGSFIVKKEKEDGKEVMYVLTPTKPYARIHELGYEGTENVKAHTRNYDGKAIEIAAHTRNMKMPVRSYIRTSVEEYANELNNKFILFLNKKVEERARQ